MRGSITERGRLGGDMFLEKGVQGGRAVTQQLCRISNPFPRQCEAAVLLGSAPPLEVCHLPPIALAGIKKKVSSYAVVAEQQPQTCMLACFLRCFFKVERFSA